MVSSFAFTVNECTDWAFEYSVLPSDLAVISQTPTPTICTFPSTIVATVSLLLW